MTMMDPGSALALAAALLMLVHRAAAAPFSVEDNFVPACGSLLPDPPPGGWKLWSSPATWQGGPVPGIGGSTGVNVTIPCGVGVLLDLPLVQLTVVSVLGALKFKDDPSLPLVNLTASFIIVEGRFIIGSSVSQFRQRAEIRLAPNPFNRTQYAYTAREPADPANPRAVGHKAFAVVGGQVDFHGLPGNANTLSWTKLLATARAGDSRLLVKGDVSSWPVGAPLVIAPTDFYPDQEDVRTITAVTCAAGGQGPCNITLDKALAYNHFGDPLGVPDGFGGYIDETAEVALLTRRISVTGTDEPAPYQLEGGHFIVYMTNTQQILEGVQFLMMGQQGKLGRYNIHFHLCGDQARNSIVRKNLMMHSKQRCLIVHATHNLKVEGNVAYNTSGHCYILEEGGETGNTFVGNLGLRTRAVVKKIADDETDDEPATFWITNPNNSYINNAAAGSEDSGFWMELRFAVRGLSLKINSLKNVLPINVDRVGTFLGNTAHSNNFAGYRAYPNGFMPRHNASADGDGSFWDNPVWVEYGNFNLWKNNEVGAFIHDTDHVVFSNSSFADNVAAIQINEVEGVNLTGHRIVGDSNNYGNPMDCQEDWGTCGPITGCAFPLAPGVPGRGVPWGLANQSLLGVVFDQNRQYEEGQLVNLLSNTTFSGFDPACKVAAAVAVGTNRQNFWNAGHGFQTLRFSNSTVTNKIYLFPKTSREGDGWTYYSGEVATMYAIRDLDGSVVGTPGGYVVANNSAILPPATFQPQCAALPQGNAFACPRTCYRTVQVLYYEPGFAPYPQASQDSEWVDGPRKLGDYSYVKVKRVEDGTAWSMEGNLRQYRSSDDNGGAPYNDSARTFPMSLLSDYTYEITIVPGANNPSFVPFAAIVHYKDGRGCGRGVTLRFPGSPSGSWAFQPADSATWTPCPGTAAVLNSTVAAVQYTYACVGSVQALKVSLSPLLPPMVPVTLLPVGSPPAACGTPARCGLTATNTRWWYNQLNQDLHPAYSDGPAFYNPLYPTPAPDWLLGPGVLGNEGWAFEGISTFLAEPDWDRRRTYYFKSSFTLARSSCYSVLYLDAIVLDGLVLYLNNLEVLRVNMPAGMPTNMTQATKKMPGISGDPSVYTYQTYSVQLLGGGANVSLAEGLNHFAAEVHVNVDNGWDVGFALRASALWDGTCTRPKVAAEVCDGVDNNNDGRVDVDPATQKLLQRPCWTACGAGVLTCILGAYQNCSAPTVLPEVCNGKDDDCDGLVDNGDAQLDCAPGKACFAGTCQPVQDLTTPQNLWGPKSPGWFYQESATDLTSSPGWRNGTRPGPGWKAGSADFGVFPDNAKWNFTTALAPNGAGDIHTRYFVKPFNLTVAEAGATFGYALGLRRCDGAVVYLNGEELFRSNMPAGTVSYRMLAASWSAGQASTDDDSAAKYYLFGPLRAYGAPTQSGTNWLAAEVHGSDQWQDDWVFDLTLTWHVTQPCSRGVTPCVRRTPRDAALVRSGDPWKFLDASAVLPGASWMTPAFDDSAWSAGATDIGQPSWVSTRMATSNSRTAYYFRRTVSIADGACFFNLTLSLFANDGAVVYINGAEAKRVRMPAGNVTASMPATDWPPWTWERWSLSTGWLRDGKNVIAAEVHRFPETTDGWMFDFELWGQREGMACTPLPA